MKLLKVIMYNLASLEGEQVIDLRVNLYGVPICFPS